MQWPSEKPVVRCVDGEALRREMAERKLTVYRPTYPLFTIRRKDLIGDAVDACSQASVDLVAQELTSTLTRRMACGG